MSLTEAWEARRAAWRRKRRSDCLESGPLDGIAASAFFLTYGDAQGLGAASRGAREAARRVVAAIRADVARGCARRAVPVVGRPPSPSRAPFPEGFRYAARVLAPAAYAGFAEDAAAGDVHARVAVAWVAAHGCWGLVALEDLDPGARVCDYTGALASRDAAKRREASDAAAERPTYVLSVVEHSFDDSVAAWRTTVDATAVGGVARFVNHSCDPNCDVVPTRRRRTQLLPTLALVAKRRVPAGRELTFDYAGLNGDATDDASCDAPETEHTATRCFCGARACRGWLLRHRA